MVEGLRGNNNYTKVIIIVIIRLLWAGKSWQKKIINNRRKYLTRKYVTI